jgi:hypothetical protein
MMNRWIGIIAAGLSAAVFVFCWNRSALAAEDYVCEVRDDSHSELVDATNANVTFGKIFKLASKLDDDGLINLTVYRNSFTVLSAKIEPGPSAREITFPLASGVSIKCHNDSGTALISMLKSRPAAPRGLAGAKVEGELGGSKGAVHARDEADADLKAPPTYRFAQ